MIVITQNNLNKFLTPKSTEELKELRPEAYNALPSHLKYGECLQYHCSGGVLYADHKSHNMEYYKFNNDHNCWLEYESFDEDTLPRWVPVYIK